MTEGKGKLLVIYGDLNDRLFLTNSLEEAGYSVTSTGDGIKGFELIESLNPEVVLLDLHITGMKATEMIQRVSCVEPLDCIPVIMLATAHDDQDDIQECLNLGAADYLLRPFSPTLLKTQVREFQEIKKHRMAEHEVARQRLRDQIEHDVQVARNIQLSFLPRELPQPEGWEISAYFAPAREVAGDFYDAFQMVQGRRVGFVIADVCDKGVGAALFMALVRSLTRAFAQQNYSLNLMDSLEQGLPNAIGHRRNLPSIGATALYNAVTMTNNYIIANHAELNYFATLFFGKIDPTNGKLAYINAGHCPPIILGTDGKIKDILKSTGTPVGMMPDAVYTVAEAHLEPGEVLFSYSDGVTDARNTAGKMFTLAQVRTLLEEAPAQSTHELLERVKSALKEHIGAANQYDDITMLAVRRQPEK